MGVSEDLRGRVERLSTAQRWTLLERLGNSPGGTGARERLVAYVVPRDRLSPPDAAELREHLRARLPEPMIPAVIVPIEGGLPRLPNGKLDLEALPETLPEQDDGLTCVVEPRTEAERVLARIWGEVLGVELVGVDDNFFELGGDSILSIRVIARAQQAGLMLEPDQIFRHQTLAALAAAARPSASGDAQPNVTQLSRDADAEFPDAGLTTDQLDRFLGRILP